mmetsp:Transcript_12904/g.19994  ORF Transcript_12904/g.19994 Transcript_12904/m.19994 type:complete len:141 (-) Transcript_12904:393-815(-)
MLAATEVKVSLATSLLPTSLSASTLSAISTLAATAKMHSVFDVASLPAMPAWVLVPVHRLSHFICLSWVFNHLICLIEVRLVFYLLCLHFSWLRAGYYHIRRLAMLVFNGEHGLPLRVVFFRFSSSNLPHEYSLLNAIEY